MRSPGVVFITHPDAPSGVDLWRVFLPIRAIQKAGGWARAIPLGQDLPMLDGGWPHVVVMNQRSSGYIGASEHLKATLFRPNKVLYVADVCDDPEGYKGSPLRQRLTRIRRGRGKGSTVSDLVIDHISAVDLVTVNSPEMAEICRAYNPNVEVMPDLIEPGLWDCRTPEKKPRGLFVGVAGGATHNQDWMLLADAWKTLASRYDWLNFVTVGLYHPELVNAIGTRRHWHVDWAPIHLYQANYRWIDIGCAPLEATRFNASKSPIRWQEYALAHVYPICSPTVYANHVAYRTTGSIARSTAEWGEEIDWAINHPQAREIIIQNARNQVVKAYAHNEETTLARLDVYARHYRRVYGVLPPAIDDVRRAVRHRESEDVPSFDNQPGCRDQPGSRTNGTVQLTR